MTTKTYATFRDIPEFTRESSYGVDVGWDYLLEQMKSYLEQDGLIMCPDFQRGHVWTEAQQIAFVEFGLRGGRSGRDIFFNHPGWMGNWKGDFVVVDGLQRLTAAMRFMKNEIRAFGKLCSEFKGPKRTMRGQFRFHVNTLKTREEVLRWYLEMNAGGTPHSSEELDRVRALMEAEAS